ncbi:MAG: carbon storage regulator [Gammaproteobacteria bacterium]|nr:MAG: carbon storage regulator [Gammaproteobacteria bacterium]
MLVITRKPMQSFKIGDDTIVTVLSVDKNQVRVAIDAPKQVRILRTELLEGKPCTLRGSEINEGLK